MPTRYKLYLVAQFVGTWVSSSAHAPLSTGMCAKHHGLVVPKADSLLSTAAFFEQMH